MRLRAEDLVLLEGLIARSAGQPEDGAVHTTSGSVFRKLLRAEALRCGLIAKKRSTR